MAFGFFQRRRKKNQEETPQGGSSVPENVSDLSTSNVRQPGEPIEQKVDRDNQGQLTPADLLPDMDLPQLNRTRADLLRRELEYRFALQDAHIHIEGSTARVLRADGGSAQVSLRTLAMNAAGLGDIDQLPELVESFVHGTLADATLSDISTATLYKSLRLRLLPTPEAEPELEELGLKDDIEEQIRDDSILRSFTSDMSIALVLDTEHAIRIQPLQELERFDAIDVLERAADRNTWQELLDASVDANYITSEEGGEGANFWAFESDSYYLGSAPLFLSDLLRMWAPDLDQSNGVIFAVPDRDLLIARPVTTGENLMNGITSMVRIAMRFGLGSPTSISPRLHLLHENNINTFTDYRFIHPEGSGEWEDSVFETPPAGAIGIEVRPDAYLMERLQEGGFGDFGEEPREFDI
ncbi:hypothetical protein SFC07_11655 [Corynebacterium callunae]|uniref:hypothetical protein n=1 Tax=Corynebacterium callunae TaxID=1721 RepID=UPI0039824D90